MFGKEKYADINSLLNARFEEKKALIAVHRGAWGGNIIENTTQSYRQALAMGADIFELDISCSTDGVLYTFHDGNEWRLFKKPDNIKTMSSAEIDSSEYFNCIGEPSGRHAERFAQVLDNFTGGELFNIDRGWWDLPQVLSILDQHPHALRQAVLKSPVHKDILNYLDAHPTKYMYMPICYSLDDVNQVLSHDNINVVGVEAIAFTPQHDLIQPENLAFIHDRGFYIWVNSITLGSKGDRYHLFTDLDDDNALLHGGESWKTLLDMGIDVLQTDWPAQLAAFRAEYYK